MELIPVDHDPFAAPRIQLQPVDHDPFNDSAVGMAQQAQAQLATQPQRSVSQLPDVGAPLIPDGGQFSRGGEGFNNVFGLDDKERFQFWPERLVRSGVSAMGDAMSGQIPQWSEYPSGEVHSSNEMIQRGNDAASLAMAGGIGGTGQGGLALGSGPVRQAAGAAAKEAEHGPVWHSAVENAIENAQLNAAPGMQWKGMLQNSKGVKPEEMDWLGLGDYLAEKQAAGEKVSKAELQQYVAEHKVDVKDVRKGGDELKVAAQDLQKSVGDGVTIKGQKYYPDEVEQGLYDGSLAVKDLPPDLQLKAQKVLDHRDRDPTKYHTYQLPGGENYQEHLLTLSTKSVDPEVFAKQFYDNWVKRGGDPEWEALSKAKQEDWMRAAGEQGRMGKHPDNYQSSHWDEPNILAHVRTNDRVVEGHDLTSAKSLHLEEVQSDWHQAGRKKGYGNPAQAEFDNIKSELLKKHNVDSLVPLQGSANKSPELVADLKRLDAAYQAAQVETHQTMPVPDAPFKTNWHELALKRMIKKAADEGYDRISWTPGEAQAARYDLSKQIDSLAYHPESGHLQGYKDGRMVLDQKAPQQTLPDVIGKEAADKILNNPTSKTAGNYNDKDKIYHVLDNADLKIGGEGMHEFYDKMLPRTAEKIGKAHGVKVKRGEVTADKEGWHITPADQTTSGKWMVKSSDYNSKGMHFDTEAEARAALATKLGKAPVHYFDIPPSMRDAAKQKGMPLFSGGKMLIPVDHDPFADQNSGNAEAQINRAKAQLASQRQGRRQEAEAAQVADQAAMSPETFVNPAAKGLVGGLASMQANSIKIPIDAAYNAPRPGLRREDYTDIPGSEQPGQDLVNAAGSTALGQMGGGWPDGAARAGETLLSAGLVRHRAHHH